MEQEWTTLDELPCGSLFVTERYGTVAVKSEYTMISGQWECIIVGTGEYAHFEDGNGERVRQIYYTGDV